MIVYLSGPEQQEFIKGSIMTALEEKVKDYIAN